MDDGEPPAAEGEPQLPGQRPHPGQGVFVQLRGGMGKPDLGPIGAGAVAFEPAAAIGGVEAQGFLAVSHHHPDAGIADPLDGGDGVAGVGDDVAGADDLLRGQAQGAGPGQHGVRALDVGIGAAEAQHRTVDGPEVEHGS